MNITPEQFTVLKLMAEQIMLSGDFPARHRKYIPTATQDRRVYDRFDRDGTTASILAAIMVNVERGNPVFHDIVTSGPPAPPTPRPPEQNDPFTEEALKKIGGKPDSSILNPPGVKIERGEGEIWVDDKDRRWTIRDGKKRQLPKIRTKGEKDGNPR